jgi:hypothetical protein
MHNLSIKLALISLFVNFFVFTFKSVALTKAASLLAKKVTAPATSHISPNLDKMYVLTIDLVW